MTDLLASSASWLADRRKAHAASAVTYARGASDVEIVATRGRTDYPSEDMQGVIIESRAIDWIVNADDLVIGGLPVEPAAGDRIKLIVGTKRRNYEVMQIPGQGAWRYCSEHRKSLRIHTRFIGEDNL